MVAMIEQTNSISRKEAVAQLWEMGYLYWKLDVNQESMYKQLVDDKSSVSVVACSRRTGKTYMLVLIAVEYCLRNPNTIVKFVEPQIKMIKRDIRPIMRDITKDCPPELRPDFKTNENIYYFKNGSEIQLAGAEQGNAESLRGGSSNLCIVDEAGFCSELEYLVQSILIPTTLTTNGRLILSSTPPKQADHDFVKYVKQAELNEKLVKRTIHDNPRLTEQAKERILASYPMGETDPQYRREYLCEFIISEEDAVVPEFNDSLQSLVVKEWVRPPFYTSYTAADIGFKDLTVILFAYYDFRHGKVIVEDELVMRGKSMTTDKLATEIKAKEASLWRDPVTLEQLPVKLRVSDNNLILINDLAVLHNLTFIPTAKDNAEGALNNMRMLIANQKVIINPRCKTLIFHLKNAVWNKSRTSYERSVDSGHYDAIDALKYLLRNVNFNHNPYPAHYDLKFGGSSNLHFPVANTADAGKHDVKEHFKNIFSNKKYRKS